MRFASTICCLLAFYQLTGAREPAATGHQRLLHYLDAQGREQPVKHARDWDIRRAQILKGFEKAAGPLPDRTRLPDLDLRVNDTLETNRYSRFTIDFVSEPGDRTPAYLYIPKGLAPGERRAGIVALHPTHAIGKGVVDGQSKRPNRAYAKELAERGYVVIAPDYPSFGAYANYDFSSDRYASGTMKGIWNHLRCVDLLAARQDVDPERIGAIGHSLGGHNAIFLGVFDPRVKAVVSSCGWTPFHDYYDGDIRGWTGARYMPRLREVYALDPDRVPFDFYELIAALAPRAFFSSAPLGDSNFDVRGVKKAAPVTRSVYALYDRQAAQRFVYPDAGHDFPEPIRKQAYEFLDGHLQSNTQQ